MTLPRPHPNQATILSHPARFKVADCGRRFGKSALCIHYLIDPVLHGHPVAYFAPKYKLLLEFWRDMYAVLKPVLRRVNATERRMEAITGGVAEFWTLEDKDAGRSRKYKRIVVDEAGLVPGLVDTWNEAIRPTLADLQGDGLLSGTPKGRNDFWRIYQWGAQSLEPNWKSFHYTTYDNPFIKTAEIDAMRDSMSDRAFRQEILAEFIDDGGGVFRNVKNRAVIDGSQPSTSVTVWGVDWGRTNDYTVVTVFDPDKRAMIHVDRWNNTPFEQQLGRLEALMGRYPPYVVVAERNSFGLALIEALALRGVPVAPFEMSNISKNQIVDALSLAFEREPYNGGISIQRVEWLIAELEAFEQQRTTSLGLPTYSAPSGMHDDGVIATALGWHACRWANGE